MPTNEINTAQLNSAYHIFSNIIDFSRRLTYEALLKAKPGYSVGHDLLLLIFWIKLACPLCVYSFYYIISFCYIT